MKQTIYLTILISLLFVGCGEKKPKCNPHDVYVRNFIIDGAYQPLDKTHAIFVGDWSGAIADERGCIVQEWEDHTIYFNPITNHSEIK